MTRSANAVGAVAIVGGGVAGLAIAALLAEAGAEVDLYERANDIRAFGAGVQISPNGAHVLAALGLDDLGDPAGAITLFKGETDAELARLDLQRFRPQHVYRMMHRSDLIEALRDAATKRGARLHVSAEVVGFEPGALPKLHFASGQSREADLIIGADGIHSVARQLIANTPPRPTGLLAWRAVINAQAPWQGEARIWTGAGRHIVAYPLRGGQMINLVAVEEDHSERPEGWRNPGDPNRLRAHFSAFSGQARALLDQVDEVWQWGLYLRDVPARWDHGGVVVIGDAAHPTLPFLAQGANLALEDAALLSRVLLSDLPLAQFSQLRRKRVARALSEARQNALRYHLKPGPHRLAAHNGLTLASKLAPNMMLSRFDWLYNYNPMTASLG